VTGPWLAEHLAPAGNLAAHGAGHRRSVTAGGS